MNTTFIKNAADAFEGFIAACGNDVATAEGEYVVFSGQIATDQKGNIKVYALINDTHTNDTHTNDYNDGNDGNEAPAPETEPKKVLVSQFPFRPVIHRGVEFFKSLVDLYEADKEEAAQAAEAEAKAEAEAAEKENADLESKINDLQSEISSLKLRKKSSVRYVKQRF